MSVKQKELQTYQKTLITQATLQRALLDARNKLEDKEVFLSAAYHAHLNSLASYMVGRTGRKDIQISVRVMWDSSPRAITAYTDNRRVVLNVGHPKIQAVQKRSDRNLCLMGMACHEFAHCLFSNFPLLKKQHNAWMEGKLYPYTPKATPANEQGLQGIQAFLDKGERTRSAVFCLYQSLDNTIEDGYVERSIVRIHQGDAKKSLHMLNQVFFGKDFMEFVKEAQAADPDFLLRKWSLFENAVLTLLKMGTVHIDPTYNAQMEDINQRILALVPRIVRELENANALSRKALALDIMLENWDLIESEVEWELSKVAEPQKPLSALSDEELENILARMEKGTLEDAGAAHDDHIDSNNGRPVNVFFALPAPSQEEGEEENKDEEDSGEKESGGDASGEDADEKGSNREEDSGEKESDSDASGEDADEKGSNREEDSGEQQIDSDASGVICILSEEDGDFGDDSFRKAFLCVENEMAQEKAEEKVEEQLHQTLQANANASATNDSWRINIIRSAAVPERGIRRFDTVWPRISLLSKTLKKELLKVLQERRQGGKQTGLICGRRLDTRSLYRSDEKYFSKNRLPNEHPKVATALLIDQSGSMGSSATDAGGQNLFFNKIQAAGNAAVLLYDFCVDLGFPMMVAGHTIEHDGVVDLEVMASFQKVDKNDRYRICAASAFGGNRDGTALNYLLTELKHRPEEIKLLFIISDGLPSGYLLPERGVQHLQEVLADAQRSGVLTFAAALEEDIPQLKHIYGERLFEMTDLARMPRTLLNVLRRYIK